MRATASQDAQKETSASSFLTAEHLGKKNTVPHSRRMAWARMRTQHIKGPAEQI